MIACGGLVMMIVFSLLFKIKVHAGKTTTVLEQLCLAYMNEIIQQKQHI
jgi:hypothetical protein